MDGQELRIFYIHLVNLVPRLVHPRKKIIFLNIEFKYDLKSILEIYLIYTKNNEWTSIKIVMLIELRN